MPRHVWLCTRPLSYGFPGMEITSDTTRLYLRHWGVLVSELAVIDAKVLIQTINSPYINITIGTMYELMQYDGRPDLFVDCETTVQTIKDTWRSIHLHYVGETVLMHDAILREGIVQARPLMLTA
jgi:hypothetical protein